MNNLKKQPKLKTIEVHHWYPQFSPPGSLLLSLVQATQNSQPQPDPVLPVVN